MKNLIVLAAILVSVPSFASERADIAKSFAGSYELKYELNNDTRKKCAPALEIKYWEYDKLLDLQFLNPSEEILFVNASPVRREFIETSFVFDVINKVNISSDEKYKTVTRVNTTRISEKTYKGKPDKYKLRTQVFLSRNIFNGEVRYEFINKKKKVIECLYK